MYMDDIKLFLKKRKRFENPNIGSEDMQSDYRVEI